MKKLFLKTLIGICFSCLLQAKSITVTSPKAGDVWNVGTSYAITWTSTGVTGNVNIRLRQGNNKIDIVNITPNSGSYSWQIPATIAPGSYYLRINSLSDDVSASSAIFTISAMRIINQKPHERIPHIGFKLPRLVVSDIDLTPNTEGFGIIFSYKNNGDAALPRASEIPVKPSYRVLIDGRETARGFLVLPAFPAGPGWQQTGCFGGWIVFPKGAWDYKWYMGNMITVYINENKVLGMDSNSLSLNLKNIALKYSYDLICNSVVYNWDTNQVTISVRLDGKISPDKKMWIFCSGDFTVELKTDQRLYSITKKLAGNVPQNVNWIGLHAGSIVVPSPSGNEKIEDIDQRNNAGDYRFSRPPKHTF